MSPARRLGEQGDLVGAIHKRRFASKRHSRRKFFSADVNRAGVVRAFALSGRGTLLAGPAGIH